MIQILTKVFFSTPSYLKQERLPVLSVSSLYFVTRITTAHSSIFPKITFTYNFVGFQIQFDIPQLRLSYLQCLLLISVKNQSLALSTAMQIGNTCTIQDHNICLCVQNCPQAGHMWCPKLPSGRSYVVSKITVRQDIFDVPFIPNFKYHVAGVRTQLNRRP